MNSLLPFIAFVALAQPEPAAPPHIEGIYRLAGEIPGEPAAIKYSGSATIRQDRGSRTVLVVTTTRNGAIAHGMGIIAKDGKSVSIFWTQLNTPAKSATGVTVYRIADKSLLGEWISPGMEEPATENLRWLGKIQTGDDT